jgi:vesicle-fusing ATPase
MDEEQVKTARRLISRANIPAQVKQLGQTDTEKRRDEATERQRWEQERSQQQQQQQSTPMQSRSALGKRNEVNGKPDVLLSGVDSRLASVVEDRKSFEQAMQENTRDLMNPNIQNIAAVAAAERVAEIVAKAGGGANFNGETLGIGGLDEVIAQIRRRVWVPLAAPPQLLKELGIHPVRGLLLYGRPGCGKTLMARQLGRLLSPLRPITVVSGPEILDKFVGSSEKNLREVFDNVPDIYDTYRLGQADKGEAVAKEALHVIVLDEFDAIARTRGGRGGSGEQGDAGVARDSVVNQLLAKMDGFDPPVVPTLVIALTNKRSLIEPALLRPGRFEVQVEVPPPSTQLQRISILKVHTTHMHRAGRLLVTDAPDGSAASKHAFEATMSYDDLLDSLANECDGFSGASIAGVCRAAASHALERAVEEYAGGTRGSLLTECVVTIKDFEEAVKDVVASSGDSDWATDKGETQTSEMKQLA